MPATREYMISSDWVTMSREIEFLMDVFLKNGYHKNSYFLHVFGCSCTRSVLTSAMSILKKMVSRQLIFSIPYIGLPSIILGRKLKAVFDTNYDSVSEWFIPPLRSANTSPLNAKLPCTCWLMSIIYQYEWLCDTSTTYRYIGKTKPPPGHKGKGA